MTSKKPSTAHEHLVTWLKERNVVTYNLGYFLKRERDEELWRQEIGDGINTWADYLAQPEIGLTVREANDLIRLFEFWDGSELDPTLMSLNNYKFLSKQDKINAEMIASGQTLSPKDYKERYYDYKTKDKGVRTYTYMVMARCNETGNLNKIHGVESEDIISKFKDKIDG